MLPKMAVSEYDQCVLNVIRLDNLLVGFVGWEI